MYVLYQTVVESYVSFIDIIYYLDIRYEKYIAGKVKNIIAIHHDVLFGAKQVANIKIHAVTVIV